MASIEMDELPMNEALKNDPKYNQLNHTDDERLLDCFSPLCRLIFIAVID